MKTIPLSTGLSILLTSQNAYSNPYSVRKHERAEFRVQGGAGDITSNFTDPAVVALQQPREQQFRDVHKDNPSKIFVRAYSSLGGNLPPEELDDVVSAQRVFRKTVLPFAEDTEIPPLERLERIEWFNDAYLPVYSDVQARFDVIHLQMGSQDVGMFVMGMYSEFDASFEANHNDKLAPDYIDIEDFDRPFTTSTLVYETPRTLMRLNARADVGGTFGYGKVIPTDKLNVALGAHVRGYKRFRVDNGAITLDGRVNSKDDILLDSLDIEEGIGTALDTTILVQSRAWSRPTFGMNVRNMGVTHYEDGTEAEIPQVGVGVSFTPFNRLQFAIDAEQLNSGVPSLQVGTSYMVGNLDYNATFHVGAIGYQADALGRRTSSVTAGASLRLKYFGMVLGHFLNTENEHNMTFNINVKY